MSPSEASNFRRQSEDMQNEYHNWSTAQEDHSADTLSEEITLLVTPNTVVDLSEYTSEFAHRRLTDCAAVGHMPPTAGGTSV